MANLLKPTDALEQGYPKINAAIGQAEQSLIISDNAMDTANSSITVSNQALANSQSTQEQLNQIVIDGDSSVEAAQARVNADNSVTYDTLKERLDAEHQEVNSHLADIAINVKIFGAIGDGVTDDTNAILNAIDYTLANNKTLLFSSGYFLFKKSSVPEEKINSNTYGNFIPVSSLMGNNATLIIDGMIGFETSSIEDFKCVGLNFKMINGYGTDNTSYDSNVVFYNGDYSKAKTRLYQNLVFDGVVTNENGSQRYKGAIYENVSKSGYFNNITSYNIADVVRVLDGTNFTIDNVSAYNFQTCIYTSDTTTDYKVLNIKAENTFEQSQTWLTKNDTVYPKPEFNGLDLFLGGGDNYSLINLNAINPIERCIYSQGGNIIANNLRCVNGDGFKFVGNSEDDIKQNVKVSNCVLVINEDITTKSIQPFVTLHTLYWIENVDITNSEIIVENNVTGFPVSRVIPISRHVKNINLTNIKCNGYVGDSLVYVILESASDLTADKYLVAENVTIDNCFLKKNNLRHGSLFMYRDDEASADAKLNYVAKNINIINSNIEYGDTADQFMYTWKYVDGFRAKNNRCNKLYDTHGLLRNNPLPANNVVLIEHDIPIRSLSTLLAQLKLISLSNGSQLSFIKNVDNRIQRLTLNVYMGSSANEIVTLFNNSNIKIKIYLTAYESFTDMPVNYMIKVNSDDGYYIGHVKSTVRTDLVATSPVTLSHATEGSLTLRGDTYMGKSTVEIESSH